MNILLTISLDKGLYCNGLQQNIIFLAELLKDIGCKPFLVVTHDIEESIDPPRDMIILQSEEIADLPKMDYCLQTGWLMSKKCLSLIKQKNPNCKNIHIHYGNRLLADVEQCKWENICVNPDNVDEVWVSPHYEFSFSYFKTFYKTQKVFEIPYIWSPKFIKCHNSIWNKAGLNCYYDANDEKNIAILEPNLNMTKNCIPSIFIVEELINQHKNLFNQLNVYCAKSLMHKRYFKSLMWCLDITKQEKIKFSHRKNVSEIFARESNIVVSHQLLNGLNYTYLEALYFNIPLVHNSEYIKDAGYFYPEYDTILGAKALHKALTCHDDNIDIYEERSRSVIERYSPKNNLVIEKYKKLLT
jgi:hypothetical protein